jgi:hypothetical protein
LQNKICEKYWRFVAQVAASFCKNLIEQDAPFFANFLSKILKNGNIGHLIEDDVAIDDWHKTALQDSAHDGPQICKKITYACM